MALLYTEFLSLACSNVAAAKRWWIAVFDCRESSVPVAWDCQLPSDVALKLPGADEPTILLSDKAEIEQAGYERGNNHPLIFCSNLKKALEHLRVRNAAPGPVQDAGGTQFFEVHDPEGNAIEICKEP